MSLPDNLQLSQSSLQDYADCRRRFQLRYLLELAWPAIEAEPALEAEQLLRQGALFHRMIQQHLLGVPAQRLTMMAQEEDLARWWHNYLHLGPALPAGTRHAEVALSIPLGDRRLLAKYDLLVAAPGQRAVIFDWKTSRRRPARAWLEKRWQTRVYPFVLAEAGAFLNGGQLWPPEQIEMVYWFAQFPDRPERFAYSRRQHEESRALLLDIMQEMATLAETDAEWPLTPDESRCTFCVYRSLCNRGIAAGDLDETELIETSEEAGPLLDLDFEQIAEIAF